MRLLYVYSPPVFHMLVPMDKFQRRSESANMSLFDYYVLVLLTCEHSWPSYVSSDIGHGYFTSLKYLRTPVSNRLKVYSDSELLQAVSGIGSYQLMITGKSISKYHIHM